MYQLTLIAFSCLFFILNSFWTNLASNGLETSSYKLPSPPLHIRVQMICIAYDFFCEKWNFAILSKTFIWNSSLQLFLIDNQIIFSLIRVIWSLIVKYLSLQTTLLLTIAVHEISLTQKKLVYMNDYVLEPIHRM